VECFGVEVPFYRGWERGLSSGEGRLNGRSNGGDGEWRLRPLKLVKAWLKGDNYCGVMEEGWGFKSGGRGAPGAVTRGRQRPWPCCDGGRKKKEKVVFKVYTFSNGRRQSGRAPLTRGRLGREGELGRPRG
jgi:hypothetical protein